MPTSDRLRRAGLATMLVVGGCRDQTPAPPAGSEAAIPTADTAAADTRIPCAQGQGAMTRACTVERKGGRDGPVLTVRNPGGGFHRFTVLADGTGIAAADGAEPARVTPVGNEIEIALGGDRYRLPARTDSAPRPVIRR